MTIHGKDIGFFLSVDATQKIGKLLPGGVKNIQHSLSQFDEAEQMMIVAQMGQIMATANEINRAYEDPDYQRQEIALDMFTSLPVSQFPDLAKEIFNSLARDAAITVESEAKGKN